MVRADGAAGAGGVGDADRVLHHQAPLADDGPHADGHGAVQAGCPQRGSLLDLLSAYGDPRIRGRYYVDRARTLAEPRDEVGPPGLRPRQRAAALLGQSLRGSGLDRPRDAALPARLAASVGGGLGTHGPHQLPAAAGDLHDDLLRPRPRPLRPRGPGRPARDCAGSLGVPVAGVLHVAPLLRGGAGGMGHALARVQTTAQLPALLTG